MLIKVKFLRNEKPAGKPYTYRTPVAVKVGDLVQITDKQKGVVTEVDTPESEVESFKDSVKTIVGLAEIETKKEGE